MVSIETAVINEFMQSEYGITPNPKSLEILVNVGFKKINNPSNQFSNLESVERKIRGNDFDSLVAKVFSLAFPYEHVLKQQDALIRDRSAWLGAAEYRLGRAISDPQVKNILFNKGLEHLLKSREKGNGSEENASRIGRCYFELRRYGEALEYFLESRQKGDGSGEKASLIGRCYFGLRRHEEALEYFLESRQKGDGSKDNASHIGSCYFGLRTYGEALKYFLESRQKGNGSKDNACLTGECYFRLSQFEEGISEYERAVELARKESFNINWMRTFDHVLEDSFYLLARAKETIQSPFYGQLVQRFQAFYNNFVDFWKANEPNKDNFRLIYKLSNQTGAIGVDTKQAV